MNNILMNTEMTLAILNGRKTQTRRVVPKHIEIIEYDKGRGFITYSNNGSKTHDTFSDDEFISDFPKYAKDEVVWAREPVKVNDLEIDSKDNKTLVFTYKSDNNKSEIPFPKRLYKDDFLPKWVYKLQSIPNGCIKEMARIFLKITDVRVERLQDISKEDAIKEGIRLFSKDIRDHTQRYYNYTKGKRSLKSIKNVYDQDGQKRDFVNMRSLGWLKHPITSFATLWNETAPKGYRWDDNPYVFIYEFENIQEFPKSLKEKI